ncbi:tetratricopeptide repeat protein [bacterium]|jgi:tetratricopeptide (TPR) repeat protein|nr:tetratricopeptide repeat protein [bacterium]
MTLDNQKKLDLKRLPLMWSLILVSLFALMVVGIVEFVKPLQAELNYRNGYFNFFHKQYDKAILSLQKAVDYAPWETHYRVQLGKSYEKAAEVVTDPVLKLKLLEQAKIEYERIVEIDDKNPWYLNRLGAIHQAFSKVNTQKQSVYLDFAHKYIKEAAENDRNNPLFQMNMAFFYHKTGFFDKAESYYKKALDIDSRLSEAAYNYAELLLKRGDGDGAYGLYKSVYDRSPNFGKAAEILADLTIKLEKYSETEVFLTTVVEKDPTNQSALQNFIIVLFKLNKFQDVIDLYDLNKNVIGTDNAGIYKLYVQSLIDSGQLKRAKDALEEYLIQYPENEIAQNDLNSLKKYIRTQSINK